MSSLLRHLAFFFLFSLQRHNHCLLNHLLLIFFYSPLFWAPAEMRSKCVFPSADQHSVNQRRCSQGSRSKEPPLAAWRLLLELFSSERAAGTRPDRLYRNMGVRLRGNWSADKYSSSCLLETIIDISLFYQAILIKLCMRFLLGFPCGIQWILQKLRH